jgi:hypothetical protein
VVIVCRIASVTRGEHRIRARAVLIKLPTLPSCRVPRQILKYIPRPPNTANRED